MRSQFSEIVIEFGFNGQIILLSVFEECFSSSMWLGYTMFPINH